MNLRMNLRSKFNTSPELQKVYVDKNTVYNIKKSVMLQNCKQTKASVSAFDQLRKRIRNMDTHFRPCKDSVNDVSIDFTLP